MDCDSSPCVSVRCSSLPELLEKKRLIDLHTNVATAVLDHIKVSRDPADAEEHFEFSLYSQFMLKIESLKVKNKP